jgi:hypothetical protein
MGRSISMPINSAAVLTPHFAGTVVVLSWVLSLAFCKWRRFDDLELKP